MKAFFLISFLAVMSSNTFANSAINYQCNSIIYSPNAGMQIIVAQYRKLCGDLAKAKNLSPLDLHSADCSSSQFFSNGPDPIGAFRCLEARFGSITKSSSGGVECQVMYDTSMANVNNWKKDSFNVVDDNRGAARSYQVGKKLIKVQVNRLDDLGLTSIQWEVGNVKGVSEGGGYARVRHEDSEVFLNIECE